MYRIIDKHIYLLHEIKSMRNEVYILYYEATFFCLDFVFGFGVIKEYFCG